MSEEHGRAVTLIVVGEDGKRQPGWTLRAGDLIERTDYDHGRRLLEVRTTEKLPPLRTRLRRWWERWR